MIYDHESGQGGVGPSVRICHRTGYCKQPIDLLAIGPAYTTCNTVCILARPSGQLAKQQAVIYLMRAYKVTLFSVHAGEL
jgi:hypothetical protein